MFALSPITSQYADVRSRQEPELIDRGFTRGLPPLHRGCTQGEKRQAQTSDHIWGSPFTNARAGGTTWLAAFVIGQHCGT